MHGSKFGHELVQSFGVPVFVIFPRLDSRFINDLINEVLARCLQFRYEREDFFSTGFHSLLPLRRQQTCWQTFFFMGLRCFESHRKRHDPVNAP